MRWLNYWLLVACFGLTTLRIRIRTTVPWWMVVLTIEKHPEVRTGSGSEGPSDVTMFGLSVRTEKAEGCTIKNIYICFIYRTSLSCSADKTVDQGESTAGVLTAPWGEATLWFLAVFSINRADFPSNVSWEPRRPPLAVMEINTSQLSPSSLLSSQD